jgi:hypothetical protein
MPDDLKIALDAISKLFVFDKDPPGGELIVVVFNGISRDYANIADPDEPLPGNPEYEAAWRARCGARINGEPMAWREIIDKVRKEAAHARGN